MNPKLRSIAVQIGKWRDRMAANFPIATEAGKFLQDPSPPPLLRSERSPTLGNPGWQLVTSDQYGEKELLKWCEELQIEPRCYRK